jgi:hypothetical protein
MSMDARTFDALTMAVTRRPTRRAALRLLAGGLTAGLLSALGVAPLRAAMQADRDGDQLYDDDETNVYGTNPDNPDSDCDGVLDGPEIYYGTDPLGPPGCAPGCPQGQIRCLGICTDVLTDAGNCGACFASCQRGDICVGGGCLASAPSSSTICAVQGLDACGDFCTNLLTDAANCGACGNACAGGDYCAGGVCQRGCLALGSQCVYGVNECCGGACLYGVCQCSPSRDVCSNGSTCCSGVCGGDGFCT